jgi:carbonic anhydrase
MHNLFVTTLALLAVVCLSTPASARSLASAQVASTPLAQSTLAELLQGNQRFVTDHAQHPHQSHAHLLQLVQGQHPKVAILTCSDARVAPELIFDQGLGDVFDVRVAGNIVDDGVLGSLEYAVEHLHVDLILVLGHQHCGAVQAAMAHQHPHNEVNHILRFLNHSVKHNPHASEDEVITTNINHVLHTLQATPTLNHALQQGHLTLVGGFYHLDSGKVEVWPATLSKPHPHKQSRLTWSP